MLQADCIAEEYHSLQMTKWWGPKVTTLTHALLYNMNCNFYVNLRSLVCYLIVINQPETKAF